ncbi:MAG TPA: D-alanyl-D-alanine carboxypeptidase, partial [Pseudonocardia sp.]|nr:D-alanyl-D-alanine carboxypeptidase [Pseudonocardia sp.]
MGVGGRVERTLRVPGGGLRALVALLVVVTIAVTTTGALALTSPALAERLGLDAPAPDFVPPVPRPVLRPLAAGAPAPSPAGVAETLDPLATSLGRLTGVVVDPATGTVLWERAADEPVVPGSTGKILTAAAALLTLEPTGALVTRAVAGPEPGTVVLVGGGDPTLTALPPGEESVYPDPARLTELADAVRRAAPGPVRRAGRRP